MANVFITGASTGIGENAALRLDWLGHRVFAGVRRQADGDDLAGRASDRLTPVICDVTDDASVTAAIATIESAVGESGLQGLVNNAGVARGGPLEHLSLDEWREQFEVNVFGQITVTKGALPLIRQGHGRICFIGSLAGRMGSPLLGPYAGSKFAIEGIAQALREELRPWDIAVSVVEPGPIKTPIWQKGREYASELEGRIGAEAAAQYRAQIDSAAKGIDTSERIGASVSKTSAAIEHALLAPKPKYRYLVGAPAKATGPLMRLLPDKALSRVARALGP